MTSYAGIEKKVRRAIRNDSGTRLTVEEMRALVSVGILDVLSTAINAEMKAKWLPSKATAPDHRRPSDVDTSELAQPVETLDGRQIRRVSAIEALIAAP